MEVIKNYRHLEGGQDVEVQDIMYVNGKKYKAKFIYIDGVEYNENQDYNKESEWDLLYGYLDAVIKTDEQQDKSVSHLLVIKPIRILELYNFSGFGLTLLDD